MQMLQLSNIKVRHLCLRFMNNSLPSIDNSFKRNISKVFQMWFHMESILLLIQDCPISKDVCVVRLHTKQQGHEDVDEPPDYYSSWSSYSAEGVMLAWTLWYARNLHLFISGTNANCKFYLENCIRYLKQVSSGSNTWTINGLASQPRGVNVATTKLNPPRKSTQIRRFALQVVA